MNENNWKRGGKVHRELGHGLFETVYEVVLARELESRGV